MLYSWAKDTDLANCRRNRLCRGAAVRPEMSSGEKAVAGFAISHRTEVGVFEMAVASQQHKFLQGILPQPPRAERKISGADWPLASLQIQ